MGGYILEIRLKRQKIPDFAAYPFSIPALRELDVLPLHPGVTFFVGENGAGKSTLLEAIAAGAGLNPEGGTRNFQFSTYDSHSVLCDYLTLVRGTSRPRDCFFFRAESFYNVATEVERLSDAGMGTPVRAYYGGNLHARSHGESFFALVENRLGGQGLYLFDEPESALSPTRQLAMLEQMHRLVRADSQLIIATHSPILMAYPDSVIYAFSAEGIRTVSYEETEQYRVTLDFLRFYPRMLHELMGEGNDGFSREIHKKS